MKRKGVPKGYKHEWDYNVKRYNEDRKGNFTEVQSKSRTRKTKHWGGLKKGSKLIWQLQGHFYTRKRRDGRYETITIMRKRKKKVKPKGKRRWY